MKINGIRNNNVINRNRSSLKYILFIVVVLFLAFRFLSVLNSKSKIGSLPYIQLLNFSMPIVEVQTYKADVYMKNKLDLKEIVTETLGLKDISTYGIISNEVSFFKNIKIDSNFNIVDTARKSILPFFSPFELSENSIVKVTEEDLAQLDQVSQAYNPNLKPILEEKNKKILLYNTHSHEGYAEIYYEQGEEARYRSDNDDIIVRGVSDILAEELQQSYGIEVIYDKTIHDNNYDLAYYLSEETVQGYMNEYGDFDMIIDLHRDGFENPKEQRQNMVANINGQNLARMMFVTSIKSETLEANTMLANTLADISDKLFPGLMKDKRIFHYEIGGINGFNMSFSENFVVWEVGSNANTSVEAKLTAKYIARIIAEYLKDK